jgi:hypothetical protein
MFLLFFNISWMRMNGVQIIEVHLDLMFYSIQVSTSRSSIIKGTKITYLSKLQNLRL